MSKLSTLRIFQRENSSRRLRGIDSSLKGTYSAALEEEVVGTDSSLVEACSAVVSAAEGGVWCCVVIVRRGEEEEVRCGR